MKKLILYLGIIVLYSCHNIEQDSEALTSIQLIDKNGFSETISSNDRLKSYQNVNFLSPQPYQKVMRIIKKDTKQKSKSLITSYHPNGTVWQYLEVINGRANGLYKEWHANGQLKLQVTVIEGPPDINPESQVKWVFDGVNKVWDERGNLVAEINYEKGSLNKTSLYFHPNGKIRKSIPYENNNINGLVQTFSPSEKILSQEYYINGVKDSISTGFWESGVKKFWENYNNGLLDYGYYYNKDGNIISSVGSGNGFKTIFNGDKIDRLEEYKGGMADGEVKILDQNLKIFHIYNIKDGKKDGDEWWFYDNSNTPKLCISWKDDYIVKSKSWYKNGSLESQKEFYKNKKHGKHFAWYQNSSLMLIEDYENDQLINGSYFKIDNENPVSEIKNGDGIATIFDNDGTFLQKIEYEKSIPQEDSLKPLY